MGSVIRFLLGDEERRIEGVAPTATVLDWLRESARMTGTKEGCAEGDCGACTVILRERTPDGKLRARAVNACILFVGQLHLRQVLTIEHLGGARAPHPVQQAFVEAHASQCGFCTPGLVMQVAAGAAAGRVGSPPQAADWISGNLCRCTGYGGLLAAAVAANGTALPGDEREVAARLHALDHGEALAFSHGETSFSQPRSVEALARTLAETRDPTPLAGATDIGLWVTKGRRRPAALVDVTRVDTLKQIADTSEALVLGAAVTHAEARPFLARLHPDLDELMRRFAGEQVRASGTVGGNIANGSPIGDLAPALLALDAAVTLRSASGGRTVPLDRFFIAYGRQDRRPDEFVERLTIPRLGPDDRYACYKLSKRFDSDISAVMAAFRLRLEGGVVSEAWLAFGGMAATPKRAAAAESALRGRPFDVAAVAAAQAALETDFAPIGDLRASAGYRRQAAGNLLRRFWLEGQADRPATRVLAV